MPDLKVHAVTVNLTVALTAEEVAGLNLAQSLGDLLQLRPAPPAATIEAPRANGKATRALPPPKSSKADRLADLPTHCEYAPCGKRLKQTGMGRAKRFCNSNCRNSHNRARGRSGDDEAHGAAATPSPKLSVAPASGRLVMPTLPRARPQADVDELPPRPVEVLPGQGHDPTRAVVELPASEDEAARRRAVQAALANAPRPQLVPGQRVVQAAPSAESRLLSRFGAQRGRG
jgi:hypothetical protein